MLETPTQLLQAFQAGDESALDLFIQCVLGELRRRARLFLQRENPGHTLQPTALVNEAFLRLFDGKPVPWTDTNEFFLSASREMRRVLTDHARKANAQKRQQRKYQSLDEDHPSPLIDADQTIQIDQALDALEAKSKRAVSIVEMRFFGGLGIAEIASILGVHERTVKREWAWARAWLLRYHTKARQSLNLGIAG